LVLPHAEVKSGGGLRLAAFVCATLAAKFDQLEEGARMRIKTTISAGALVAASLLGGCSSQKILERLASPEKVAAAKSDVDLLRQHRFEEVKARMDPSLVNDGLEAALNQMAGLVPEGDIKSIKVVGANSFRNADFAQLSLTLEYEFSGKWLLAEVVTKTQGGQTLIEGFHIDPLTDSLEHANRFRLTGLGAAQWVMIFLALVSFGCSVYAFVICVRSKVRRKWLWAVVTLFGVGRLALNWTSGAVITNLIWVEIPTVQASAGFYSPWFVSVSLPIGALLFLAMHSRLEQKQIPSDAVSSPVEHS
jgi:hypothetical protein